jgi:hypothetical protein
VNTPGNLPVKLWAGPEEQEDEDDDECGANCLSAVAEAAQSVFDRTPVTWSAHLLFDSFASPSIHF